MRILDLNNNYSPSGGGIRVYHEEKLAFYSRQTEHVYALMVPSTRRRVERAGSVTRYELPAVAIPGTSSRHVLRAGPIIQLLEEYRPDLVELGSFDLLPRFVRAWARNHPTATVGFFHQDYPESYVRAPLGRLNRRLGEVLGGLAERHAAGLYGGCTAAFGASEFSLGRLRALGVRRVFKTPLGVDLDTFRPGQRSAELRASLGAVEGRRLVLFLGRLAQEKGIALLADAWPQLAGRERIVLAVAGHGPLEKKLEPFFRRHPEIRRLPYLSERKETAALLASADLVLSLGRRETFSLVTLEAMACGTPVLAGGEGGAGELVREAGVVPPFDGSAAGLARGIVEALQSTSDEKRRQLRAFAAARYDWPQAIEHLTACYGRVLEAFRAGDLQSLEIKDPGHCEPKPRAKRGG